MAPILGIWASQISGHLWAPTGAYDALATVTVPSGGVASVEFAGIPTGYKHLQIRYIAKASAQANATFIFNGDTAANYSWHVVYGTGSGGAANATGGTSSSNIVLGTVPAIANVFAAGIVDILDYANTSKYKTTRALTGEDTNGAGEIAFFSGNWRSTSAVTSIKLSLANFSEYSQFALYGVK